MAIYLFLNYTIFSANLNIFSRTGKTAQSCPQPAFAARKARNAKKTPDKIASAKQILSYPVSPHTLRSPSDNNRLTASYPVLHLRIVTPLMTALRIARGKEKCQGMERRFSRPNAKVSECQKNCASPASYWLESSGKIILLARRPVASSSPRGRPHKRAHSPPHRESARQRGLISPVREDTRLFRCSRLRKPGAWND